jgi:hypothetical protein
LRLAWQRSSNYFNFPMGDVQSAQAVDLLLDHGADINAGSDRSLSSRSNALRILLEGIDNDGLTTARGRSNLAAVQRLVERGIALDSGGDPLENAAKCKAAADLVAQARCGNSKPDEKRPSGLALMGGEPSQIAMALWELARNCDTHDKLELLDCYVSQISEAELNFVRHDHEDRTVLHNFLRSIRSSALDEDASAKLRRRTPTLAAYTASLRAMLQRGAKPSTSTWPVCEPFGTVSRRPSSTWPGAGTGPRGAAPMCCCSRPSSGDASIPSAVAVPPAKLGMLSSPGSSCL